jgi:hypothetical protein
MAMITFRFHPGRVMPFTLAEEFEVWKTGWRAAMATLSGCVIKPGNDKGELRG